VNFAISTRGRKPGLDHLGIQAENETELDAIGSQLAQADVSTLEQKGASCCYAKSDKYWTLDPQGIAGESFHSLGSIPLFGGAGSAPTGAEETSSCGGGQASAVSCCAPTEVSVVPTAKVAGGCCAKA